jgi:hypothetical protein
MNRRSEVRYDAESGVLIVPPFEVAYLAELLGPQGRMNRNGGCLLLFEAKGETVSMHADLSSLCA